MGKQKVFPTLVITMLVISIFTSIFFVGPISIRVCANPGDVDESWYNATTLNVTVTHKEPRINWYDLQNATNASMLNAQLIDVNENYYFKVNISSDQGWADIEYIWIKAWYDNGTDPGSYNGTPGGNINLNITYDNSSESASAFMSWPNIEATFNDWSEVNVTGTDPYGVPGYTETYNLTFNWTPGYQFRHATGDGLWDTTAGINDIWSWNFNITVKDDDGWYSYHNPAVGETVDEFGVYSYTNIVSADWPEIVGSPGDNATADINVTLVTRSNGNYSLSVGVDNLTHTVLGPSVNMSRDNVWVRGGDLDTSDNFTAVSGVIYLYGGFGTYHLHEANDTSLSTSDVEYKCDIPLGQIAGNYTATIRYHLTTT